MTREEELALLIEEQRKDDTHIQQQEPHKGWVFIPLDRPLPDDDQETLASRICGQTDDGEIVTFIGRTTIQHGHSFQQIEHGTYNGYHNQRCRCRRCTDAHTAYIVPKQRARRKKEQNARPDQICENENCGKHFRPVPSTKRFCSPLCSDATRQRLKRARIRRERLAA